MSDPGFEPGTGSVFLRYVRPLLHSDNGFELMTKLLNVYNYNQGSRNLFPYQKGSWKQSEDSKIDLIKVNK